MSKFQKLIVGYKVYYAVYLLLAFNAFVNGEIWFSYLTYITAGFGGVIVLLSVLRFKRWIKDEMMILLLLFLATWLLTTWLHRQYGMMENVQAIIWLVIQTVVLYGTPMEFSVEQIKREFAVIASVYTGICAVFNVVSLSMLFWGYQFDYMDSSNVIHAIGFRWSRLWGVYDDPNHGAILSVVAVLFALYMWEVSKKKWRKFLFLLATLLSYAYIVLSDSRTGFVGLIIGLLIYAVGWCKKHIKSDKKVQKAWKMTGVFTLLFGFVACTSIAGQSTANKLEETQAKIWEKKEQHQPMKVSGRQEDIEKDVSSGRLELWADGLTLIKKNPILGVGQRNMAQYAKTELSKSRIVKNGMGIVYDSLHNMPLDVALSQGLVGILILFAMGIVVIWQIMKKIRHLYETDMCFFVCMLATVVSVGCASMFLSMVFYVHTPATYCFWLALGYLMTLLKRAGKQ